MSREGLPSTDLAAILQGFHRRFCQELKLILHCSVTALPTHPLQAADTLPLCKTAAAPHPPTESPQIKSRAHLEFDPGGGGFALPAMERETKSRLALVSGLQGRREGSLKRAPFRAGCREVNAHQGRAMRLQEHRRIIQGRGTSSALPVALVSWITCTVRAD